MHVRLLVGHALEVWRLHKDCNYILELELPKHWAWALTERANHVRLASIMANRYNNFDSKSSMPNFSDAARKDVARIFERQHVGPPTV